jgi:hypothetical protein
MVAPAEIHPEFVNIVKLVSSYMIFGGGIIVAISGLTVDRREDMEEKMQKPNTDNKPVD